MAERRGKRIAAGALMYRVRDGALEVYLAHPGGPFFSRKDDGVWTIPKGEVEPGEDLKAAARREFREEIGLDPDGPMIELGSIRQRSGKIVHGWAFEAPPTFDESEWPSSVSFQLEWPPRSGRTVEFPEVDRAQFFGLAAAARKIIREQHAFIERLRIRLGV